MPELYDIVIIGGGPAGLAAALYASRGRHSTLVVEKETPGGKITHTASVDDYPGLPEGMSGADLSKAMWDQATKFGAELRITEATGIVLEDGLKMVRTTGGDFKARAVILATGGQRNHLGVPGEKEFEGKGVSCCALHNARLFQGKPVAVMGDWDSALSEALSLSQYASKVTVIHPGDELRAIELLQEEAVAHPKIEFLGHTIVEEVLGDATVTGVRVRDVATGATSIVEVEGVFINIGNRPNSNLVQDLLPLQGSGHVPTDEWMTTNVPGIFVAGDVRAEAAELVISAAGDGATAAIAADHYLSSPE